MELHALGFNDWFQRKLGEIDKPGYSLAHVTAVNRDNYLLRNETSEVLAELTGRLMFPTELSIDLPNCWRLGICSFFRLTNPLKMTKLKT